MMFGAAVSSTVWAVTGESSGGYVRLVLVAAQAEGHGGLERARTTSGGCALRGDSRRPRRDRRPGTQELLSGISDKAQFERLRSILDAFADEPITTAIYVEAARLDNVCLARGVQCGEVDMLLCATALHYGWTILTSDAGLLRCIQVVESDRKDRRKLREKNQAPRDLSLGADVSDEKKAVVLLSGGLDSTTVAAVAKQQGFQVYALSFDYGRSTGLSWSLPRGLRLRRVWRGMRW